MSDAGSGDEASMDESSNASNTAAAAAEEATAVAESTGAPAREKGSVEEYPNSGPEPASESLVGSIPDSTNSFGSKEVEIPNLEDAMATLGAETAPEVEPEVKPESLADKRAKLCESEKSLLHYDRLLLSNGARLLHALPIVALIFLGVARTFGTRSPGWWDLHIRPSLDASFSFIIGVVVIFVLVAHLAALSVILRTIWLTRTGFDLETKMREVDGRRFRSVHGHAKMRRVIESSYRQSQLTTMLVAAAIVLQILALLLGSGTFSSMTMLALGTAALMVGYGIYLLSLGPRFNSFEPWGLLESYEAPLHPALLDHAFFDVIGTHLDPILSARLSEFVRDLSPHISESLDTESNLEVADARERLLHLLLLDRRGVIDETTRDAAFASILDEAGVAKLNDDSDGIGKETWDRIIDHAKKRNPSFFRMYDRVRHRMHEVADGGRPPGGIWFDVDMENLVSEEANLFIFVHNGTDQPRNLVVRILTPDFRPEEITYTLHLKPGEQHIISDSSSDAIDIGVVHLYHEAGIIWQTLLPARTGEATVTARLEDPEGNLVTGRVITVQVRYDLAAKVRVWAALLLMAGGGVVVLSRLVEPILAFLTL